MIHLAPLRGVLPQARGRPDRRIQRVRAIGRPFTFRHDVAVSGQPLRASCGWVRRPPAPAPVHFAPGLRWALDPGRRDEHHRVIVNAAAGFRPGPFLGPISAGSDVVCSQ